MAGSPDAAKRQDWRNVKSCMCSVTVSEKGTKLDQSACPIHGKSKARASAGDAMTAATTRKPKYWSCPRCGTRNERIKQRCAGQDCTGRRPKRRVPAHARTLRDDSYLDYRSVNDAVHGPGHDGAWTPDCCGVCGKPPSTARHMDRDHDHTTGHPRGLACPGNQGCNALMPRQLTLERARLIVAYLERVDTYYAQR